MTIIIILSVIGSLILFISAVVGVANDDVGLLGSSCIGGCLLLIIILFIAVGIDSKPTALDVYQGKTTLEITYKDSIPIDSVVVFK